MHLVSWFMKNAAAIGISGVGAISPLGAGFKNISEAMLAGTSGIREVSSFDVKDHPCRIAGQVTIPPCPPEIDAQKYAGWFPLEKCAAWSCVEALKDAGLWAKRAEMRIGMILGLGAEWMQQWDQDFLHGGNMVFDTQRNHPPVVDTVRNAIGLRGPSMSVATACASGNLALAQALRWLQMGWVDVCLAGAVDVSVTPISLASFGNLRALSRRNDSPRSALRPFDRDRDGMVLGEGGAVFVLENIDHARTRQRNPLAEVASVGLSSDAYHLVIPSPDPTHAIAALQQALAEAELNPEDVDYVNAHATGTPVGDVCEARVLQSVFGTHTSRIPVSATKSMTGHLVSAAAAVEAVACLTAITYGAIPPTVNLDHPDPECDLCHVANQAREHRVRVAVSNSYGFGGHNSSLVLKAVG
ncbi:MAG TPA: beta-ketoacyl-[acyl-carrier-protein] synthase family protein [Pirellulales bacterium]|jgi:3-oxoacyl-[acyl-carrier-protein] synthase II|nr:beta-ketoacyl-[acyl-carrier-protein] synthase family protein [Pirellulales bacterium]